MSARDRTASIARLREWLRPGDTVNCILRHVSRSGMQREIGVVLLNRGVELHPNYAVAEATGHRVGKRDGVIVSGCGMDMGFHLVYTLGHALFPEGFGIEGERVQEGGTNHRKVTKKRPKTKAEAARMVAEGWKFFGRNGDESGWDDDGGYALKSRWL